MTIGILQIGTIGNVQTIVKSLQKISVNPILINNQTDLHLCDKIILPGVGSFFEAMSYLKKNNLFNTLRSEISNKCVLGICLGMQILCELGYEGGEHQGLSLIPGTTNRIITNLPIPHLGFNKIQIKKKTPILKGVENEEFYFMHSYHLSCKDCVTSLSEYGDSSIVASIEQNNNIFGTQFHPECSRDAGLQILKNFVEI